MCLIKYVFENGSILFIYFFTLLSTICVVYKTHLGFSDVDIKPILSNMLEFQQTTVHEVTSMKTYQGIEKPKKLNWKYATLCSIFNFI